MRQDHLRADQLRHRRGERFRCLLRHIMTGALHHAVDAAAGEFRGAGATVAGRKHTIGVAIQRDGGYRDWRQWCEAALQLRILWIARGKAEAMAVAMDHDVDEIRIV